MATTTVTGEYLAPDGSACRGRVSFRLVSKAYQEDSDAIYPTVTVSKPLSSGTFSIELEPTSGDDAALDGEFTYQVTERINGSDPVTYWVDIPTAPSVDIGTLTTYDVEPGFTRQLVVPDLSTLGVALDDEVWHGFNPTKYGAVGDGVADDAAAMQDTLQAMFDAGGGTMIIDSAATYLCESDTLTIPDDGGTPPLGRPMAIIGSSANWSGRWGTVPEGGRILITAPDTYGKIKTRATSSLVMRGVTVQDDSGDTTPLIYTTNTALDIQGCALVGSKTTAWDQDAIILGGTTAFVGVGDGLLYTDGFQGYGTVIAGNRFDRVRRAVYGRTYCNGVVIRDNMVSARCGYATGAAIEINGSAVSGSNYAVGNVITGNLIEVLGYKYGIYLEWSFQSYIAGNSMFDSGASMTDDVHLAANTESNRVVMGFGEDGFTDLGSGNIVHNLDPSTPGTLAPFTVPNGDYPTTFQKLVSQGAGADAFLIQPAVTTSDASALLNINKSVADGAASVYSLLQRGGQTYAGTHAGNVVYNDETGAARVSWSNNGRTWTVNGTGNAITVDTGGAHNIDLKGFRLRLQVSGARKIGLGTGQPTDGSLTAGEAIIYFDDTNGNAKISARGKTADGTVVQGDLGALT